MTLALPNIDPVLVNRLAGLETTCTALRLNATRDTDQDPLGAVIERHGPATVFATTREPDMPFFNIVHGMQPEQAGELDTIFALHRRHGITLRAWTLPGALDATLAEALIACRLRPHVWWSVLYREVEEVDVPRFAGVTIRRAGADDAADFGRVAATGFEVPEADREGATWGLARWVTHIPEFDCHLAFCDGAPAAIGVLYRDGELAYLAAAATLPEFRGRGCQTALIAQRLRDARAAGCEIAVVQTGFATPSQRNQERAGFRLAATCQTWAEPQSDAPTPIEV